MESTRACCSLGSESAQCYDTRSGVSSTTVWWHSVHSLSNNCTLFVSSLTLTRFSVSIQFSEDCLYLNIFTPRSANGPLPVMIFVPGGNFQYLDASIPVYESEHLVNTTNVIIALIQYRLGQLVVRFDGI
jgi:carboxylesterase type B